MHEGYCVKCKARKPISDATEETMKNGRKAVKGKCPTCTAVMFKILGGKAILATSPEISPAASVLSSSVSIVPQVVAK
jgi:Zn finger protein HypA/HybF involved in hydrogenase expression